ncbi:MAG: PHP domain-containing protein [Anaerolineales bacterium]|nr:PHP domain-containing protein [Anaerolineales bacterium]MCB9144704.1 PHP domain-containing protein [Anaerolineales bacterium]
MGLADLHLHTIYSYDGTATVPAVLRRAKSIGLNVIAITDHDEIAGALEAEKLASHYGVEVIPGSEITTAEGDLLALFIHEKIKPGLSLIETLLRIKDQGGIAIAAHPMAGGMGMKSLTPASILRALKHPIARTALIGIETYNGTAIDRISNHATALFANGLKIAHVGNSDAHIIDTIGFGATEFPGTTAADLLKALHEHTTRVHKLNEWSAFRVISSWGFRYIESAFARLTMVRA